MRGNHPGHSCINIICILTTFFRSDIFEVADKYHYDDGSEERGEDTFMREPFVILLTSTKTLVPRFAIIGKHSVAKICSH